ncbi:Uncharacterized protein conserved in bacteria with the myosin-like domain [[Flavobacterium] thermophilum]|nr:Uncharacterized protein conserved in bacteria with the myosin-like domain [[Flavobacterium] thermophilum]
MKIASGAARAYQISLYNLTLAARGAGAALTVAGTAIRSIGTFLGTIALPTAAFMALGWAIGKVTEKIIEYKEHQKQIKQEAQQLANTYATNKEKIQSLADQYERLSNEVQKGLRPKDDEEYLKVQQELYNLIPTVASYVDQKGQAHLRSAEAVRKEIDSIKELSKLESNKFIDNFSNNIDKIKNKIDNLQNQINNIKNPVFDGGFTIPNYQPTSEEQIEIAIKQREINAAIEQAIGLYKQYADAYADTLGVKKQLNEEDKKYIETIIEENRAKLLTAKGQEEVTKKIKDYIGEVGNARKAVGDLFTGEEIRNFTDKQKGVIESISKSLKNSYTDWEQYKKVLEQVGFSSDQVDKIINRLTGTTNQQTNANIKAANSFEILAGKIDESGKATERKLSVSEKLLGISNSEIDAAFQAISTYQLLSNQENLNTQQSLMLADAKEYLANLYPHLVEGTELNIAAMRREAEQNQILLKAIDALKDGHLTAEQQMTLATALNAKSRLQILMQQAAVYEQAAQNFAKMSDGTDENAIQAEKFYRRAQQSQASLKQEIEAIMPDMDKWIQQLADATNYQGQIYQADEEAKKKNKKSTEESIYVTDKYKQALSKLNAEIQKLQTLQSKYPKQSESYRNALKQEITLLQQKKQLMQEQAKSLEQQIKSGKIQQTGIISTKSTSVSGNSKEAIIWNFFKSKGFSDSVVAGILGNLKHESGLSTTIVNPTSGATGLAQWLGSRLTGLKNYAASLGKSWTDLNVQLDYMWKELNSTDKKTLNWLLSNQDAIPSTVATMFEKLYDRAGGAGLSSRISYANQYYQKFANGNVSGDVSKQIAEQQQSIDQAKEDLNSLKAEISDLDAQIAERYMEIHRSKIAEFDLARERIRNHQELYELEKQSLDENSKAYRQRIQNQIILEQKTNKALQTEIKWAENQIKNDKKISASHKEELRQFIAERQKMLKESNQKIVEWQEEIIISSLHEMYEQIDKAFNAMEDRVSRLQHQLKMLGDVEFHPFKIDIMTDEIDALIQEREQTRKDLNRLKQEQKKLKKDSKPYKENLAKIAELEKRLMTVDENIVQADADLKDYYTRVAEQVIEAQKKYYEEKKQAALSSLDAERQAIESTYEAQMKAIEEAHDAKMKAIDEELRALEKLKDEEDYNKQLDKLNKERQEILNKINKLALDDSQEANAKRIELQKQLAEKEDEINEFKHNREYELRRQNLEDLREKLNEEYENERETREKSYEDLTENLDKRREEIEKYYDDIINDTRRWDNVTQQILSGQFNNLRTELNNIQVDIDKTMNSASSYVYELVKALEDAQKAMASLGNGTTTNYNETHKQINETLDDPVYWDGAELKDGQIGRIKILKPINLWKRDAQGKLQFVRVLKPGEVFRVYGYDEKYGGQYNVGSGYWITNMKGYVQYETPSKEKLREAQMFDTGGYTGEDEGLAYLHKKEIVLNETDTKNFLDTVKELRSFDSMQILDSLKAATMSFMRIPKIQLPNLSPALAGGGTIQIDNLIHIDKVEKDANINIEKLADQAIDRLITKLKPYGFFK